MIKIVALCLFSGCSHTPDLSEGPDLEEEAAIQARFQEAQARLTESGIRTHEVVLGMEMQDVQEIWGNPQDIESAGDPSTGNQRWLYFTGLTSRHSSLGSTRIVYFENGRVAGWENGYRR